MKPLITKLRCLPLLAMALTASALTGCVYYEEDGYSSGPAYSRGYDDPILMPNVLIVEGGVRHDYAYYRRYPHIYQRDRLRYSSRFGRGNSHHYRPSRPAYYHGDRRPARASSGNSYNFSYTRNSGSSHGGGHSRPGHSSHGGGSGYSRPGHPSSGGGSGYSRPGHPSSGGGSGYSRPSHPSSGGGGSSRNKNATLKKALPDRERR